MEGLSEPDKQRNDALYDIFRRVENLDAWSEEHKEQNYHNLAKIAEFAGTPLDGTSCLDVGCGTGDLSGFLRQRNVKDYLGIDIYEPSLDAARKKYDERFENRDILVWDPEEKFDYAFSSGALSTRLDSDNNAFLEKMVKRMWELTNIGVSFNFLTEEPPQKEPELFYYSVDRVMAICKGIVSSNGKVLLEMNQEGSEAHVYLY